MAIIHNGFIDRRFNDSFKDSGLNDTDIATVKFYKSIKPMWQQLGFENESSDNPNNRVYWSNIIPKNYKLKQTFIYGITEETINISGPSSLNNPITTISGSKTPRTSYKKININENTAQQWKGTNEFNKQYYYPVLPRIDKYGIFTNKIDELSVFGNRNTGSWDQDDDSAPITNLNEVDDDLILNIDFDQSATDDLIDKTNLNKIHYNQDYEMELDDNLRIVKSTETIPDSITKDNSKQAF